MEVETIIIGAGQAGLSVARYLKEFGRPFLILERNQEIGQSWLDRYDSLILDSFAKYSHLEGVPFPGDQRRQPTKHEVAEYLRSFAEKFSLTPQFATEVLSIKKEAGRFSIHTSKGKYSARNIVLATGPFQKPYIPSKAEGIPKEIFQMHALEYKNPSQLRDGATLVVGGGNSGAEIAGEIAESGREVFFSFSKKLGTVASSPFSQWMAYVLGLAHLSRTSLLGRGIMWYTMHKAVGIDIKNLLSYPRMHTVGRFIGVNGESILCERAEISDVQNIIWATGYESDFSVLAIPEFDPKKQRRGVSTIEGLYVLNIRWQWSKSSSHLAGVSRDAKYIAKKIAKN